MDVVGFNRIQIVLDAVFVIVCFATPDSNQFFRQVESVMDAAVHAHAPKRVVDVGGIAGEKGAAFAVAIGNPLMCGIDAANADVR